MRKKFPAIKYFSFEELSRDFAQVIFRGRPKLHSPVTCIASASACILNASVEHARLAKAGINLARSTQAKQLFSALSAVIR
jgi:hypothetical protein